MQPLEPRLALAYTVQPVSLTTNTRPATFAWVIAIDDNPVAPGGAPATNLFMQYSTDGNPHYLIDTSSDFSNPTRLSAVNVGADCTTILVISSNAPTFLPGGNPSGDLPVSRGATSGNFAHSFTFQASTLVPTARLIVDLSPAGSRISLESPWRPQDGFTPNGGTEGEEYDWGAYRFYGGYNAAGQAALFASEIGIASDLTSSSRWSADGSTGRLSGFTEPVRSVKVSADISALDARAQIQGTSASAASVTLTSSGTIKASRSATILALGADVRVEGKIDSPSQTYRLNSVPATPGTVDPRSYTFTTYSQATNSPSGLLIGQSIGVTLGNAAGGTVALSTQADRFAFQSGVNANGVPFRYDLDVSNSGSLAIDSVGASSAPVRISAQGNLSISGDAIRTSGDLSFIANGQLNLSGSVSSAAGSVNLQANKLTLGSAVTAGGSRSVSLRSTSDKTTANATVRSGGIVKQTVRVATTQNLPALAGLLTVDGVVLQANDAVLVKNQDDPTLNGIYVAQAGAWTRRDDANSSAALVPGFVVMASEGTQEGAWTLQNSTNPIFIGTTSQTGLQFVPVTATQVYDEVDLATTSADGNFATLSGFPTIDGTNVVAGMRILIKDQDPANKATNGLYYVDASGVWSRTADANTTAKMIAGSYVFVKGGTANRGRGFALDNDAIELGVTPLSFEPFTQQPAAALRPWAPSNVLQNAVVATTVNVTRAGLQTIDGYQLKNGDRVLVKNQTNAEENGVFVAGAGDWVRSADADTTVGLPRATSIFVTGGTQGRNTSWTFDDSVRLLGRTTTNGNQVTDLVSTSDLEDRMLVSGPGIVSGTTVVVKNPDGTSVRISNNARAGSVAASLMFTKTSPVVVDTTPIAFIPTGSTVTATSFGDIDGVSRLQGAAALLTAGFGGSATSKVDAKTAVGRISATAPGSISIDSDGPIELDRLTSKIGGNVSARSLGTISALGVIANGSAAAASNVDLTSVYGDVVVEAISTNYGDITLTALAGAVWVGEARRNPASLSTAAGNVSLVADTAGKSMTIDGRVVAQSGSKGGAAGGVTVRGNDGRAVFTRNANVTADTLLTLNTPNGIPQVDPAAIVKASSLDLTSPFGVGVDIVPLSEAGPFNRVKINRTDAGDLRFVSQIPLTVDGGSTTVGSIAFTAPNLTIAGAVLPTGPDADLVLTATANDLLIDAPIGSQRNVTLSATGGKVTATGGGATALITAPADLTVNASSKASISAKATGFSAALTAAGATLDVTDPDSLRLKSVTLDNGGTATFTIGSVASGGDATVGLISAGATGQVTINAYGNIVDDGDPGTADVVAGTATLTATTGKIALDTDVDVLTAAIAQKNQPISITDVGTTGLEVKASTGGNNANISIAANGPILATDVVTTGTITLTTTGTADILVNNVQATDNVVTLTAGGSILEATPADPTADIVGATVALTATGGRVDSHVAAGVVSATAKTAESSIKLRADNNATLGTIDGRTVAIIADGLIQQQGGGSLAADDLTVTSLTGKNITLNQTANNKVGNFSATTVAGAARGDVVLGDSDAGLVLGSITGNAVSIVSRGTGPVTQSGAMDAVNLTVNGVGNAITLDNAGNKIAVFASSNAGGDVLVVDTDGDLAIASITGRQVRIEAAGAVTQSLPITATSLDVRGNGTAAVTLDKNNSVGSFKADSGTGDIYFRDTTGFDVAGITGGKVILLAAGAVTQSAAINATALEVHNAAAGAITLNQNNNLGSVKVGNGSSSAYVKDASGDLVVTGINGGSVILLTAGNVTQTAAINASALQVHNYAAGAVTLSQNNNLGSVTVGNGSSSVFVRDSSGDLDVTGINGGHVTIIAAGAVTQSAVINAGLLEVHGNGSGAITLGLDNNVTGFKSGNGGADITFLDKTGGLDIAGVNGGVVSITSAGTGGITQSAAIGAASLTVSANGPALALDQNNSVATLVSATNPGGNVTFVNSGSFTAGPVQAGPLTATRGDGNILLKSVSGNITVTGDLTAKNDRVTLEARSGTFTLTPVPGVKIDANMLVYYVATTPTPNPATAPAGTYPSIIAANGDLTISSGSAVAFGDYTTDGNITITGSSVTIDGLLQTTGIGKAVTITATAGNIAFVGAGAIDNAAVLGGTTKLSAAAGTVTSQPTTAVSGGTTNLTVGQALSFAGPISASTLGVTGAGGAISLTGSNVLDTVAVSNGSGNVSIKDTVGGLVLQALTGAAVTVEAAGAVTQTGVITATSLAVTGTGAAITLDAANKIGSFTATNGAGNVSVRDAEGGLSLGAITGGTVTVVAAGAVSQTAPVAATALAVHGTGAGGIVLTAANSVGSFSSGNGAGAVSFRNSGGVNIAGINGGPVTIAAGGGVTQSAVINAGLLEVNGNGTGAIALGLANNVTGFKSGNGAAAITFRDASGGLDLAGITGGAVTITAAGAVTQTAPVVATTLGLTGVGQPITLTNAGNSVSTFNAANNAGAVALTSANVGNLLLDNVTSGPLTVSAAGNVFANQVKVSGNATISTAAGRNLTVSLQANGLLSATGQLDLRGVRGVVTLANGGRLSGNPVLVNSGTTINVGGTITTTAALNQAFATVATLPTIVGSTYEIVVGASLVLTQTLVMSQPITLRGTSPDITLNGSATATTGLVIGAAGSGSRVTSLAFSGFSGAGLNLNAARNVLVDNVSVNYAGTGLLIAGNSTGTRILGNRFSFCPIGINIQAATNATIGGTAAGQPNRITSSARAGVFASGICTGSSVIKTVFASTPAPYNLGASRGLRVVR